VNEGKLGDLIRLKLDQAEGVLRDTKTLLDANALTSSIINRAYYAMFYAALAAIQTTGRAPRKHRGVINVFDMELVRTGIFSREMSSDLHAAFHVRQESDYLKLAPLSREEAEALYRKAVSFVRRVKEHMLSRMAEWE
jgi:uncharacterized protein (UPF0332 family)